MLNESHYGGMGGVLICLLVSDQLTFGLLEEGANWGSSR